MMQTQGLGFKDIESESMRLDCFMDYVEMAADLAKVREKEIRGKT
jgi:hypothetical protein